MVSTGTEAIEPRSLEHLRGHFRGALLRPGEEGYDEARRIWNGPREARIADMRDDRAYRLPVNGAPEW